VNRRQKILIGIAGLIALGFVMYLVVDRVFLVPAAQRMNDAKEVIAKINHARAEKKKEGTYQNRLKELAAMTFSLDENHSSEQVRSRVAEILGQSGLSAQNLSLKPLVSSRVPGVYKEIGWLVRARGKITHVINFLYLLSREPHLHRLDNLILSPVPGGTDVELQVKYGTLVLELPKGEKAETDRTAEDSEPLVLQGAERGQYETIATRNLFLPYIPAAPVQKPPPAEGPRTPTEPTAPRVPEGRYRLVGLPAWGGQPDVLISDAYSGKVASYKLGDDLAGGKIVTVDYRPLPLPSRPDVVSASRVVLQVGARYYAVELGTSLAEKRPLPDDQVPPNLPKLEAPPAPQPAAAAEKSDTHK
jgi:hypothetical protein